MVFLECELKYFDKLVIVIDLFEKKIRPNEICSFKTIKQYLLVEDIFYFQ